MKMEEKLNEIENLLADFDNNANLFQEKLLNKYDNDVPEEQYLNDKYIIKYLSDICEFIGKRND
jgi:hypothetical protein